MILPALGVPCVCCTVVRIVRETLTAYRPGKADGWAQLFSDGTSRRQVAMQNLVLGVFKDDKLTLRKNCSICTYELVGSANFKIYLLEYGIQEGIAVAIIVMTQHILT